MRQTKEIPGKMYYGVCVQFDEAGNLTITQSNISTRPEHLESVFVHKKQIPQLLELIKSGGKQ